MSIYCLFILGNCKLAYKNFATVLFKINEHKFGVTTNFQVLDIITQLEKYITRLYIKITILYTHPTLFKI